MNASKVRYQSAIVESSSPLIWPNDADMQKAIISGANAFHIGIRNVSIPKAAARGKSAEKYWAKGWGWTASKIVKYSED